MRRVYILPNLFTAAGMYLGILAIFEVIDRGDMNAAIFMIIGAAIIDTMDGAIARLTRTQSMFGMFFDSLADVVGFGVAPAVMVYSVASEEFAGAARACCGLYAVCGALRLARFNVIAVQSPKKSFKGLPIPAAALTALACFWTATAHETRFVFLQPERIMLPVMVVLAGLMVSPFEYFGVKSLRLSGRHQFEVLVAVVCLLAMMFALKQHLEFVLLGFFLPYALSGPIVHVLRPARKATGTTPAAAAPEEPKPSNQDQA